MVGGVEETHVPGPPGERRVVYCLLPADLAEKLHDALRAHFRDDPGVEVVVERRGRERRSGEDRRSAEAEHAGEDRRRVRGAAGRRIAERRAELVPVEAPELPRKARRHADRLTFVERLEPPSERAEDLDTARVVARFQAGDREAFATLYTRYFDRVFSYLRIALRDLHDAEDAAQQVFARVFEKLDDYERRRQPFRAWLFTVVKNQALGELRRRGRLELVDPTEIDERREQEGSAELESETLSWIADRDLMLFVERLPMPQRQVLVLRFMLDLSDVQIAKVLGRSAVDVRTLQHRALAFLRERFGAVRAAPDRRDRTSWQRRLQQAPVIRRRRFAISRPPGRQL